MTATEHWKVTAVAEEGVRVQGGRPHSETQIPDAVQKLRLKLED